MNVPARLVAFAVVLALAFGGGILAGSVIEPTGAAPAGEAPYGGMKDTGSGDMEGMKR